MRREKYKLDFALQGRLRTFRLSVSSTIEDDAGVTKPTAPAAPSATPVVEFVTPTTGGVPFKLSASMASIEFGGGRVEPTKRRPCERERRGYKQGAI